jgi:hypothetical protein
MAEPPNAKDARIAAWMWKSYGLLRSNSGDFAGWGGKADPRVEHGNGNVKSVFQ